MCVLTYVPYEGGYILTSNRDESILRSATLPPKKYAILGKNIFFPKDKQSNGTWIASHKRFTLCLLNGAEQKHTPTPPYRHSRGLVILDFFGYSSINEFRENYHFQQLEPFTLVIIDECDSENIHQLRWDGSHLKSSLFSRNEARIWSSATLYTPEVVAYRELCFGLFLNEKAINTANLLQFHHFGGGNDPQNRLLMNRENTLKTLSITQIVRIPTAFTINYEDLLLEKKYKYRIFQELEILN